MKTILFISLFIMDCFILNGQQVYVNNYTISNTYNQGNGRGWFIRLFVNGQNIFEKTEFSSNSTTEQKFNFFSVKSLNNGKNLYESTIKLERWYDYDGSRPWCWRLFRYWCVQDAHTGQYDDWNDCCLDGWLDQKLYFISNGNSIFSPLTELSRSITVNNFSFNINYYYEPPQFSQLSIIEGTQCPGNPITITCTAGGFYNSVPSSALKYKWILKTAQGDFSSSATTSVNNYTFDVPSTNHNQLLTVTCIPVINNVECYRTGLATDPEYNYCTTNIQISPAPPTVSILSRNAPTCNYTTDGSFSLNISGSTNDYGISVKRFVNNNWLNMSFSATSTLSSVRNGTYSYNSSSFFGSVGVPSGNYLIQVKNYFSNVGNQCMTTAPVAIPSKPEVTITSANPIPVAIVNGIGYHISCFGGNDGNATVTAIGGNGEPYRAQGGGFITAGQKQIKAVDKNGCLSHNSINVTLNEPPRFRVSSSLVNNNGYGITCHGLSDGSVQANISGGIPPYYAFVYPAVWEYYWAFDEDYPPRLEEGYRSFPSPLVRTVSTTGNHIQIENLPKSIIRNTSVYSGLQNFEKSTFSIIYKDKQNCQVEYYVPEITEPPVFSISGYSLLQRNGYNTSCSNSQDGSITLTVSGGAGFRTPGYMYTNSCLDPSIEYPVYIDCEETVFLSPQNSNVLSIGNLYANRYTFNVKDGNNCLASIVSTLTSPPAITATVTSQNLTCFESNDGQINILPRGGKPPYRLAYGTLNAIHNFPSPALRFSRTGLAANQYYYNILDTNNCRLSTNPISIQISQPPLLSVTGLNVDLKCKGDMLSTLTGMARGGTPPYTFTWYPTTGAGIVSPRLFNVTASSFIGYVKDRNGCKNDVANPDGILFPVSINEPATKLSANVSFENLSCFNDKSGKTFIAPIGGWGGYKWGISYAVINQPFLTTSIGGLSAGRRKYFVSDIKNCVDSAEVLLTQPDSLRFGITSISHPLCFGNTNGKIITTVSGGNLPYIYSLKPSTLSALNFSSQTLTGLSSDMYVLSVVDAKNCPTSNQFVTLTQPSALVSTFQSKPSSCGLATGQASVSITGGVFPYTYRWFKGKDTLSSQATKAENLNSGVYTSMVFDSHNCLKTTNIGINDLTAPTVSGTAIKGTSCSYLREGIATATAWAIPPKTITSFHWLGLPSTTTIASSLKGDTTYTLSARDSEGCLTFHTIYIPGPKPLQIGHIYTHPSCYNSQDGTITLYPFGGTPPYTFRILSHPKTTTTFDSLHTTIQTHTSTTATGLAVTKNQPFQTYQILPTDRNNCRTPEFYVQLTNPVPLTIQFPKDTSIVCTGTPVSLDAGNYNHNIQWFWNGTALGQNAHNIKITQPGTYKAIVTSSKGCTAEATHQLVTTNGYPGAKFLVPSVVYVGDTMLLAEISWPFPDSVQWNWPSGLQKIDSISGNLTFKAQRPGTYTIQLKAQQGICKATIQKTFTAVPNPKRDDLGAFIGLEQTYIYPNPTEGDLTVGYVQHGTEEVRITILDPYTGTPLWQSTPSTQTPATHKQTIPTTHWPTGLYIVQFTTNTTTHIHRFIKQ